MKTTTEIHFINDGIDDEQVTYEIGACCKAFYTEDEWNQVCAHLTPYLIYKSA